MENETVAVISKAARQEIRLEFEDFRNAKYCVLHVWFKGSDGTWRPGKEGLNLKVDLLPDMTEALTKALTLARESGLIQ